MTQRLLPILVLLLLSGTTVDAQNVARSYKNGMKALYNEDFESAKEYFSTAYEKNAEYEDVAYRLALTEHLTASSPGREMKTFLNFSSTADHFFNYWLGRIYFKRGEPQKALDTWQLFLNTDGYKSPQILAETQFLVKENEEIVEHYAQEPSVIISGQVTTQAGQAILKGQVIYRPENNVNQAYTTEIQEDGQYSISVVPEALYLISIENGDDLLGKDRLQVNAEKQLEKTLIITIPEDQKTGELVAQEEVKSKSNEQPENKETPPNEEDSDAGLTKVYPTAEVKGSSGNDEISMLANKYRKRNKVIANNIYFDFGTSQLKQASAPVIKRIYNLLKDNPNIKIEIAGHTDNVGSKEANVWLSQRRAEAVMNELIKMGIPKQQMVAKGYGQAFPLASNDDEENGRELNRRIEILLIE